jgi:hypothetical protein
MTSSCLGRPAVPTPSDSRCVVQSRTACFALLSPIGMSINRAPLPILLHLNGRRKQLDTGSVLETMMMVK